MDAEGRPQLETDEERRAYFEGRVKTILRAAELVEPGCAITYTELVTYLQTEGGDTRALVDRLARGATAIVRDQLLGLSV